MKRPSGVGALDGPVEDPAFEREQFGSGVAALVAGADRAALAAADHVPGRGGLRVEQADRQAAGRVEEAVGERFDL
ncbi:MAG: hypothetical protein H0V19_08250 [Euzebyales bacterium]|nr:hypothetical protein [Euzebyales bacterium]